jgi:hypothetical protein
MVRVCGGGLSPSLSLSLSLSLSHSLTHSLTHSLSLSLSQLQRQVELAAREDVHAQWLANNHTQSPWASALVAIHAAHASTPRGPARN